MEYLLNNTGRKHFCKRQPEYQQFTKLNENLKRIFILKKKSFNFEQKIQLFFNFNFFNQYPKDLLYAKYEQIF
jgi:hypothetical protein